KAPEERHRMLAPVHGVSQKVEQKEGRDKAQRGVGDRPGGQPDAPSCFELQSDGGIRRGEEGGDEQVDDPEPDIADSSPKRGKLPPPPRPTELPQGNPEQAAQDHNKGHRPTPNSTADP